MIGGFLTLLPLIITQILAFGYLYRLFLAGKEKGEFELPEWEDWKGLLVDGLKFFLLFIIFVFIPLLLGWLISWPFAGNSILSRLPLIPVMFLVGPLMSAALYLYLVKLDLKDCFQFSTIGVMLKKGAFSYSVPTLAFLGILLLGGLAIVPFTFFFGATLYFYIMGYTYKELESSSR